MKPTITLILDTRSPKSGGYPVKLRITFLRQQKYYPVKIDLTKEDFNLVQNPGKIPKYTEIVIRRQLKEWKLTCDAAVVKATEIINKLDYFSFRAFEIRLNNKHYSTQNIFDWYTSAIEKYKSNGQIGTASSYTSSLHSLKDFSSKLIFRDVTVEFLQDYEKWLLANGKSITTVGVYLRPLRAILNQAIEEGIITRENNYPFSKRKYQIPSGKNVKKALTKDEIIKIFQYKGIPGSWWERARDVFIFSYLASGINMKDIALLKYQNIDGDFIRFSRAKTQGTNRSGSKPISINLCDEIKQILNRWKGPTTKPNDYLFPVIELGSSPERQSAVIKQFTRMTNTYLKLICIDLEINKPVTTYFARHSFATILRRGGASTAFISESLGHSKEETTASYLDSFDDESKKDMQSLLTNFII
jgi:integrase